MLDLLHTRFVDQAPAHVHATLLDEGRICVHRVRRINAWTLPTKSRTAAITCGAPTTRRPHESAALAERLIAETCAKHGIQPGQLTLHADRGASMKSKPVALLLADRGVTRTHSRPHVSNDNPFSDVQFKTLKYCPQFPDRFGSIEDGRAFGQDFFPWYNHEHRHSGLGFLTPAVVHVGQAATVRAHRQHVLAAADARHPERFVKGRPQPADLPTAVWINPPAKTPTAQDAPGTTIVPSLDLQVSRIRRPDGPLATPMIDLGATPDFTFGVSMSLTGSGVASHDEPGGGGVSHARARSTTRPPRSSKRPRMTCPK